MALKVAINGTGRIGLCACRVIGKRDDIELVALNTTAPIDTLVHLLKYDSEEAGAGGTTRFVDSSVERLQVRVTGMFGRSMCVAVNGIRVPLRPTATAGEHVGGVRYRAWQPPSCLQPTIPVHTPLTFDLVDTTSNRSLGGCRYHIDHPGGLNPEVYPINALEAESRRAGRFFRMGHTGGHLVPREPDLTPDFPLTVDLRRGWR